jgi:hypothetical protein
MTLTLASSASFFEAILSPICGDRIVLGADEDDAFLFQATREGGVLGKEAVARMHGLGAGLLAGGDDLVIDR